MESVLYFTVAMVFGSLLVDYTRAVEKTQLPRMLELGFIMLWFSQFLLECTLVRDTKVTAFCRIVPTHPLPTTSTLIQSFAERGTSLYPVVTPLKTMARLLQERVGDKRHHIYKYFLTCAKSFILTDFKANPNSKTCKENVRGHKTNLGKETFICNSGHYPLRRRRPVYMKEDVVIYDTNADIDE
jgi:hypothetical protein